MDAECICVSPITQVLCYPATVSTSSDSPTALETASPPCELLEPLKPLQVLDMDLSLV